MNAKRRLLFILSKECHIILFSTLFAQSFITQQYLRLGQIGDKVSPARIYHREREIRPEIRSSVGNDKITLFVSRSMIHSGPLILMLR